MLPIEVIYRHIAANRRIPDYGLHGLLRKSAAVVVRNLFQPILDVGGILAKKPTKGRLNNDKANRKGNVRLECAAVVQFMRTGRWEALIMMCLEEGGMNNRQVGGKLWGAVYREWWNNFAKISVYAWQMGWLSGEDVGKLHECSIRVGKAQLVLQWPKLPWSHLWIDHMYFFARTWNSSPEFHALRWKAPTAGQSACCAMAVV